MLGNKTARVSAAVLAAVVPWLFLGFTTYGEICEKSQYTGNKECSTYYSALVALWHIAKLLDEHGAAITAIATVVLAVFTWRLWWSTDKLWKEATAASVISKHAADAAKESADAATISAQAALGVELPRFVVSNIQLSVNDSSFRANSGVFTVEVHLANHGRTEAVITVDCLCHEICRWPDPIPAYLGQRALGFGTIIKPAEQHRIECQFPAGELDGISNGRGQTTLWVYGFIEYRDFLEKRHETGFVAAWIPPEEGLMKAMDFMDGANISTGTFVQEGPEAYTYNRYTKNHDYPQT